MKNLITQKELLDKGYEVFKYAGEYLFVGNAEVYIDRGDDDIIKFHDGKKYLRFIMSQKDITVFFKGELDMIRISDKTDFDMKIVSERLDLDQQEMLGLLQNINDLLGVMKTNAENCCKKTNENIEKILTKLDNLKVEPPKEEEQPKPYLADIHIVDNITKKDNVEFRGGSDDFKVLFDNYNYENYKDLDIARYKFVSYVSFDGSNFTMNEFFNIVDSVPLFSTVFVKAYQDLYVKIALISNDVSGISILKESNVVHYSNLDLSNPLGTVGFSSGDLVTDVTDGRKVRIRASLISNDFEGMFGLGDFSSPIGVSKKEIIFEYPLYGAAAISLHRGNDSRGSATLNLKILESLDDTVIVDKERDEYSFELEPIPVKDLVPNTITIPNALRIVSRDDSRKVLQGLLSLRSLFDAWGIETNTEIGTSDIDVELVSFDYVFDTPPTTSIGTIFSQTRYRNEEIMMVKELEAHLSSFSVPRMVRMNLRYKVGTVGAWSEDKEVVLEVEKILM